MATIAEEIFGIDSGGGEDDTDAILAMIDRAEQSGGRYDLRNPKSGAYGKYQFMESTWSDWSTKHFGKVLDITVPENQERVARAQVEEFKRKGYGPREILSTWLSGKPNSTAVGVNQYGPYNVPEYVARGVGGGNGGQKKAAAAEAGEGATGLSIAEQIFGAGGGGEEDEDVMTPTRRALYEPMKVAPGEAKPQKESGIWSIAKAIGLGGARGVTTELPGLAGGGLEFLAKKLGIEPMAEVGQELKDWAERKGDEWFGEIPDSGIERMVYIGSSMLAPSIVPGGVAITGLRTLLGVGKLVKAAKTATTAAEATALLAEAKKYATVANRLGSGTAAGMFGLSQAQQTVDNALKQADELEKQGRTEEADAMREKAYGAAPWVTGGIEAAGEYLGTRYLAKLFGLSEAQVLKYGAEDLVRTFLKTLGVEVGTEVGQQTGQAAVEKYMGIRPDADILAEALDVIGPTTFMTLLTGGAAVGGSMLTRDKPLTKEQEKKVKELADYVKEQQALEKEAGAETVAPWTEPEAVAWTLRKNEELKGYGLTLANGPIDEDNALHVTATMTRALTEDEVLDLDAELDTSGKVDKETGEEVGSDEKGRVVRIKYVEAFTPEEKKKEKGVLAKILEKEEEEAVAAPVAETAVTLEPKPQPEGGAVRPETEAGVPATAVEKPEAKPAPTEAELLTEFGPVGMTPNIARQMAVQLKAGTFTIEDVRQRYAAKAAMTKVPSTPAKEATATATAPVAAAKAVEPEPEPVPRVITDETVSPRSAEQLAKEKAEDTSTDAERVAAVKARMKADKVDRAMYQRATLLKKQGKTYAEIEEDDRFNELRNKRFAILREAGVLELSPVPPLVLEDEVAKATAKEDRVSAEIDKAAKAKDREAVVKGLSQLVDFEDADAEELADIVRAMTDEEYKAELQVFAMEAVGQQAGWEAEKARADESVAKHLARKAVKQQERADQLAQMRVGAGRPVERKFERFGGKTGFLRWKEVYDVTGSVKEANKTLPGIQASVMETAEAKKEKRELAPKKEKKPKPVKSPVQMMKSLQKLWKQGADKEVLKGTEEYAALAAGGADMQAFLDGLKPLVSRKKAKKPAAEAAATAPAPEEKPKKEKAKKERKIPEVLDQILTPEELAARKKSPDITPEPEEPRKYTAEELTARAKEIQRVDKVDIGTAFRRAQYQLARGLGIAPTVAAAVVKPVSQPKAEARLEEPLRGRSMLSGREAETLEEEGRLQLDFDKVEKTNMFGKKTVHYEYFGRKWGKDPSIYLIHEAGPYVGRFVRVLPEGSRAARQAKAYREREALVRKTAKERKEDEAPPRPEFLEKPLPAERPEVRGKYSGLTWRYPEARGKQSPLIRPRKPLPGPGPGPHTVADVLREVPEPPAEAKLTPVPKGKKITQLPPGGYVPLSNAERDVKDWEAARAVVIDHLGMENTHTPENVRELLREVDEALPPIQLALEQDSLGVAKLGGEVRKNYEKNESKLRMAKRYLENRLDELKGVKPRHPVSVAGRRPLRPDHKDVPMYWKIPAEGVRAELKHKYPKGTSTSEMMNNGDKTAVTRQPFAKVGETVTFSGVPGVWVVDEVIEPELTTTTGRREWEEAEGWDLKYVDRNPALHRIVYSDTAVQTILRRIGEAYEGEGRGQLATEGQAEGKAEAGKGQLREGPAGRLGEGTFKPDITPGPEAVQGPGAPGVGPAEEAGDIAKLRARAFAKSPENERGGVHFPGRESFDSGMKPIVDGVMRNLPSGVRLYALEMPNAFGGEGIPTVLGDDEFLDGLPQEDVEFYTTCGAAAIGPYAVVIPQNRVHEWTEQRATHEYTHIAYFNGHITEEQIKSINRQAAANGERAMVTMNETIKRQNKGDPLLEAAVWLKSRLDGVMAGEGFEDRKKALLDRRPLEYAGKDLSSEEAKLALEYSYALARTPDARIAEGVVDLFLRSGIPISKTNAHSAWHTAMSYLYSRLAQRKNIPLKNVRAGHINLQHEMMAYHLGNNLRQADILFNAAVQAIRENAGKGKIASPQEVISTVLSKSMDITPTTGPPNTVQPATSPKTPVNVRAMFMPELVQFLKRMQEGKLNVRIWPELTAAHGTKGRFNTETGQVTLSGDLFADIKDAAATLGHEIGHVVDWMDAHLKGLTRGNILGRIANLKKFMKQSYQTLAKDKEIRKELRTLSQTMKPFDEKAKLAYTRYRYSSAELYADAISALVNDPALLKSIAPKFYEGFFDYLYRKPAVKNIYDEIQADLADFDKLNEGRLALMSQAMGKAEAKFDDELAKETAGWKDKEFWRKSMQEAYAAFIENNQATITAKKKMRKQGVVFDPETDPEYLLEEVPYINNLARLYKKKQEEGVFSEYLNAGISNEDAALYFKMGRVLEYEKKNKAFPGGYTKDTVAEVYIKLRDKIGEKNFNLLGRVQDAFWENRKKYIIDAVEKADILSPQALEELKTNKHYVTLYGADFISDLFREDGGLKGMSPQVYEIVKGNLDDEQINPIIATMMKDMALLDAAHRAMALKHSIALCKQYWGDQEVKEAKRGPHGAIERAPYGFETVLLMQKGKVKAYHVRPYIARQYRTSPYELGHLAKIITFFSNIAKNVFVRYNVPWMVRNIVRDSLDTYKKVPGVRLFPMVKELIKSAPTAWKYVFKDQWNSDVEEMHAGMMLVTGRAFAPDRPDATVDLVEKLIYAYAPGPGRTAKQQRNFISSWLERVDKFGQFTESITKIASYRISKTNIAKWKADVAALGNVQNRSVLQERQYQQAVKGLDFLGAPKKLAHGVRSLSGTPDIYRRGSLSWLYNNFFMFSNVGKEGWRAHWESFTKYPSEYLFKTMKVTVVPKMLVLAATFGWLEDWWKDFFANISEYNKSVYNIFPLWKTNKGESVYLRVPPDYGGQVIGSLFYRLSNLAYAAFHSADYKYNPTEWSNMFDFLLDTTPYGSWHPMIGLFQETIDLVRGMNTYDPFTGKPIVPEYIAKTGNKTLIAEAFIKHAATKLGGSQFGKSPFGLFTFKSETIPYQKKEFYERFADNVPFLGPAAWTYVQVSDYGKRQRYDWVATEVEQKEFQHAYDKRERIWDSIKPYADQNKRPPATEAYKLYRELVKDGILDRRTTSARSFWHTYNRYALRTENNREIDMIVFSRTNREKAALLDEYQRTMQPQDYQRIVYQLRREGMLSNETMAALRKLQAEQARR